MEIVPKGTRRRKSWRLLVYGGSGIGKTTLASKAPKPLLIDLEDGGEYVEIDRTPIITSYSDFIEAVRWAYKSDYETIVIDTLDMLEVLLHAHVCKSNNWKSMESAGYGKGYQVAQETWITVLDIFDKCVSAGKNILCIGHEQIKTYNSPDSEVYDRYQIKLNAKSANLIVARMDAVFFAQWEKVVVKDRTRDDRNYVRGTGERVLRTSEAPAWVAKCRFPNIKETEPMDGSVFEEFNS